MRIAITLLFVMALSIQTSAATSLFSNADSVFHQENSSSTEEIEIRNSIPTLDWSPEEPILAWARFYNGTGNAGEYAEAVMTDRYNNVYVTGYSQGIGTEWDFATVKYDVNGNQVWAKRFNGANNLWDDAFAVCVDESLNVYVCGTSYRGASSWDYAIVKYSPNGDSVWARFYNGPSNGSDYAHGIVADGDNGVSVTGTSWGGPHENNFDFVTLKYSSAGDLNWSRRYDGPDNYADNATGIVLDHSGNPIIVGSSYGIGTFDDYATVKYSPTGDTIWVQRYEAATLDYPRAVATNAAGIVCVTGTLGTVQYDSLGAILWESSYTGNDVVLDALGNAFVTGSEGTAKFDNWGQIIWSNPVPGVAVDVDVLGSAFVAANNNSNIVTTKYRPNGDTAWIAQYDSTEILIDIAVSVRVDASGNIIVLGRANNDYLTIKYGQNSPPNTFSLTLPTEGYFFYSYESDSVAFAWGSAFDSDTGDIVRYDLFLSKSPTWETTVTQVYEGILDTAIVLRPQVARYWWRVRAYDDHADTWSDQQWTFRMNSLPTNPILKSPNDLDAVSSLQPSLTIQNSTDLENDTLNYTFEVSSDSSFEVIYSFRRVEDADTITTLVIDSVLQENASYWWRVKASDYYEESNYSESWSFLVNSLNSSPTAFDLTGPPNTFSAPIGSATPTLIWTPSSDIDPLDQIKYNLYIAIDSNFNFVDITSGIASNSYEIAAPLNFGTRCWWKVKALDLNGGETWSSQVFRFRTMTLGDADGNGAVSISDVVFLINYIFAGGAAPNPLAAGDANCSGAISISDAVYLIQYIFGGGPMPCEG